MQKIGTWIQKKWHICSGCCFLLSAALLLGLLLASGSGAAAPAGPGTVPTEKKPAALADFTIVAEEENLEAANAFAVDLKLKHNVSLKVVKPEEFTGNYGLYIDMADFNSYGGYKYGISCEETENGAAIYLNGSGPSLATAMDFVVNKGIQDPQAFPFGLEEPIIGYEWNADDVNLTGLGFQLSEQSKRELYTGVEFWEMKYKSFAYGKATAYAIVVKADAPVQLKTAAADWNESHGVDNPAPKHTVCEYRDMLTEDGYEVLAITNGGFYDLNNGKSNIPLGMQIVDGVVKHEPSMDNPKHTNNWFGVTVKGQYVISDTEGYNSTYEGTLVSGVGGGLVLMKDGVPTLSAAGLDYRTVAAITKSGDLILLCMPNANYAVVTQVFMDMDLDVENVLNLDGGGSTTMHTLDESGKLTQFICETLVEREVADALAIVVKK